MPIANESPAVCDYLAIDHIAIAVADLEPAIAFYCGTLGFQLMERRHIKGVATGMLSAELEHGGIKFVLCQGTEPGSQVSQLVENFGPGVAHVAFAVSDVGRSAEALKARGMAFDTPLIEGPGLAQIFTARDPNSGLSFELINRSGEEAFAAENIQKLFDALETSGKF
jgi:4-hydroxyphenylpyruvate dioxygenase-like putative hemolysin